MYTCKQTYQIKMNRNEINSKKYVYNSNALG